MFCLAKYASIQFLYQLPEHIIFVSWKEFCSSKNAAAVNQERLSAEISTVSYWKFLAIYIALY